MPYQQKLTFILIWLLFVLLANINFSYGQNASCATCGSTDQRMQSYIDMTRELMAAIQTLSPEGPTVGAFDVPGLFGGWVLQLQDESRDVITRSADAAVRSIDQRIQAWLAVSTILFTNVWDISRDSVLSLTLLSQNQAVVRDRAKLQRVWSIIQDKIFALALAAARQNRVSESHRQQIQSIVSTYQTQWSIQYFALDDRATYANLIHVLQQSNRAFERFLAHGSINQFSREFNAGNGNVAIKFDYDAMQEMQEAYKCARFWDVCAGNFRQFVTDLNTIWSENIQASRTAFQDVADSAKKLATALQLVGKQTQRFISNRRSSAALTSDEKKALSRRDQLLRTVYGSDFKRLQTAILPTIRANISQESFEIISENMTQLFTTNRSSDTQLQDLTRERHRGLTISSGDIANIQLSDHIKNRMLHHMQHAHNRALEQSQYAQLADTMPLSIYIPMLAYQLEDIRSIIGTKDTQGMLIHNLWMACELQCSNAWWTCWR